MKIPHLAGKSVHMVNLLYVTDEILVKLRQHKSYYFWLPIVHNFPLKNTPIEDRSFHPRKIDIESGCIYLTIDMKFVYARDNMFSFLYDNQDLSYRFNVHNGIVRTLENKQFTAILGKIAKVIASTEVELVETDKVHHPLFDAGFIDLGKTPDIIELNTLDGVANSKGKLANDGDDGEAKPKRRRGRPRKNPLPEENDTDGDGLPRKRGRKKKISTEPDFSDDEVLLNAYPKDVCEKIYTFREETKENYNVISEKFGIEKSIARRICKIYRKMAG